MRLLKKKLSYGLLVLALMLGIFSPGYAKITFKVKSKQYPIITRKPDAKTGSDYIYFSLDKDVGGRFFGYFYPIKSSGRHHVWGDLGLLFNFDVVGYRYIAGQRYLGQKWFFGVYGGGDWYDFGLIDESVLIVPLKRFNLGFELGGSSFGQLTVNFYGAHNKLWGMNRSVYKMDNSEWVKYSYEYIGRDGYSIQWVSVPTRFNIQWQVIFASSEVQSNPNAVTIHLDDVNRFAAGIRIPLGKWVQFHWQYIFYGSGTATVFKPRPSWNFIIGNNNAYFAKDEFQGRLKRPAERYIPSYLKLSSDQPPPYSS